MVDLLRRSPRVAPDGRDWQFIHFQACRLRKGARLARVTEDRETAVIVLGGKVAIDVGTDTFVIAGRKDVWKRVPPTLVLLPPGREFKVQAGSDAEVVIAGAEAEPSETEPRLIRPDDIL